MPLPVLSLSLAGSDPKTASVDDLQTQINAGFAALWGQTYVGGDEFARRAEDAADRVDLGALDLAVSQSAAAAATATAAASVAVANANFYPDTATGLAATTLAQQFQVIVGTEAIRYRHDAGPIATEIARSYTSGAGVPAFLGSEIVLQEGLAIPAGYADTGNRIGFGADRSVRLIFWSPNAAMAGANWSAWDINPGKVWQDSARTIAATADGDPIGAIDDVSGNGRHYLQPTSGMRPTLRISGARRWVAFAPGTWMALNWSFVGATSLMACVGVDHTDDDGYIYSLRNSSSFTGINIQGNTVNARFGARMGGSNITTLAPARYVGKASVFTQIIDGAIQVGRRNGVQILSATAAGAIGHTSTNVYLGTVGATAVSPASDPGANPWMWNFYGMVLSKDGAHRALSVVQPLERWMQGKVRDNSATTLNVILAGGQSNADGRADVAGGPAYLTDGVVEGVRIWDGTELMPAYNTDHTGPTSNGTSYSGTYAASGKFSFIDVAAHDLHASLGNVVVCRVTMGDTALDPAATSNGSWNADYASVTPGRTILLYELEKRFLSLQAYADRNGLTLNVLGLLWHQGESDRTTTPMADAYSARMTALIAKTREFTGRWNLPFVMGTVPSTSSSYNATINAAQTAIAAADARVWCRSMEDAAYLDGVHFDAATSQTFGEWAAATIIAAL